MATNFLTKLFGSRNDRLLKQYRKTVARINAMEPDYEKLTDDELRGKTLEFKERATKGESLDDLLPEAFAVVREGSKRIMKMRHFDVQLLGGMALHYGKIAEMRTGEGKTLTATLPGYLNALSGKGVHVVTVNDYLANRDAMWMGRLYNFLGLTVGINLPNMPREEKQAAYAADITYGTNNEYGFDYLRDNMVYEARDRVQHGLNFAIVDEVDSILIDEARTPLIISRQAEPFQIMPRTRGRAAVSMRMRFAYPIGSIWYWRQMTRFAPLRTTTEVEGTMKRAALASAAVLALLAGTGVLGAQETKPIKLGLSAALTGPFNEFGEGLRRGAEVAIEPDDANGLTTRSAAQCQHVRSVATTRIHERTGSVGPVVLGEIRETLALLLDL